MIDTLTVANFVVCSSNGGSKTSPALCQWSEVMNHPGLVCCVQQTTGVPLVVMVKPDTFLIQEIKTLPAKAKVSARCSYHLAVKPGLILYLRICMLCSLPSSFSRRGLSKNFHLFSPRCLFPVALLHPLTNCGTSWISASFCRF